MPLLSIGSLVLITYHTWVTVLTWLILCVLIEIKVYSTSVVFPVRKILKILFRMKCTYISMNILHFEK